MTYTLFNQQFDYSVNEVLSCFGIYLMVSLQDITQSMFWILAKLSHPADLEIHYFNLKRAIDLYWWRVKCLLRNMLLKIVSLGTSRIIMELRRIFNVNLRSTWAKSVFLKLLVALYSNLVCQLITSYWLIFCINNFSWPEFFNLHHYF